MGVIIAVLAIVGLIAIVHPHRREVCHYTYDGAYICVER